MFLIEPFVWMFKVADFKKHIKFLALYVVISGVVAFLCINIFTLLSLKGTAGIILLIITIFSFIQVPLFLSGYFWDLAQSIINREKDIVAANVYDNKIRVVDKIELPEINVPNMIWRGFASIVATILMVEPFVVLLMLSVAPALFMRGGSFMTAAIAPVAITVICIILCPALLWNYARRNSIVAVWNIPKAIYIIGNYPFRYIGKILLIGCLYFGLSFLYSVIAAPFSIGAAGASVGAGTVISFLLYSVVVELISLYFIYVYAHLIGTIAPPEEGY